MLLTKTSGLSVCVCVCVCVCLSVCLSVCVSVCVSVGTIVARWLDLATRYYMWVLPMTTARHCNFFMTIRLKVKVIWVIEMITHFGP